MPNTPIKRTARFRGAAFVAALLIGTSAFATAQAGDVREGVKAKHGEIVLVRSVPTRTAYRSAPAGMALIVDPSPRKELLGALGNGELSDSEYAAISSGPARQTVSALQTRNRTLTPNAQGSDGTRVPIQGVNGMSPMGAVGASARAAGEQVRSALGALPIPTGGTPGNGG